MSNDPAYLAAPSANVEWSPYPQPIDWPLVIRVQHGDVTREQLRRLTMSELLAGLVTYDAGPPPDGVHVESFRVSPEQAAERERGYTSRHPVRYDTPMQSWGEQIKKPFPPFKK